MEIAFKILAVILGGVAAYFLWSGNADRAFVTAVFGAVSFFLSVRVEVKRRLREREREEEEQREEDEAKRREGDEEPEEEFDESEPAQLSEMPAAQNLSDGRRTADKEQI